ncbi:MAG: UTP--glucose-1-phosphate uridylyltransferase [Syntrophobacteraceae bacterium]|nr:UTP--glucose-1-phosphate uridylyltransferase [Syntrophobacteraceae bacterium]
MKSVDSFIVKMRQERLPQAAIEMFSQFYGRLATGKGPIIPETDIVPAQTDQIERLERLAPYREKGVEALGQTVVVKLNGGLGTTMGLNGPKSLFEAKIGLSFLDIVLQQMRHARELFERNSPLVLMNSFFTESATLQVLKSCQDIREGLVHSFVQHKYPKVVIETFEPASSPGERLLEWNPAGHGDLLLAMETSGLLRRLVEAGYRYLFVSNIDNLSAGIDTGILGYFESERLDFLMEVTERTPIDRKGGHLARFPDGRLMLREASQCDHGDRTSCADIGRHPFFNTNNIWINLESVQKILGEKKLATIPFIANPKTLDPLDPDSPRVYHIESALGSAIELFERSAAIRVDRSRFSPVKSCEDLLLLWSDYYALQEGFRVAINPERKLDQIEISLDPAFYSGIFSLRSRFPHGPPSLINCQSFSLQGDVRFGRNVAVHGTVSIANYRSRQVGIEDGRHIDHDLIFD